MLRLDLKAVVQGLRPTLVSLMTVMTSVSAASSALAQAQAVEDTPTRTHAQWIRGPNTLELVWPGYAFMAHMNGHVELDCLINEKNKLKPCSVVEETPKGQGFAESALNYLEPTKMRPPTVDGAPIPDAHVQITIDYIGATGGIRWMWRSQ